MATWEAISYDCLPSPCCMISKYPLCLLVTCIAVMCWHSSPQTMMVSQPQTTMSHLHVMLVITHIQSQVAKLGAALTRGKLDSCSPASAGHSRGAPLELLEGLLPLHLCSQSSLTHQGYGSKGYERPLAAVHLIGEDQPQKQQRTCFVGTVCHTCTTHFLSI